MKTATQNADQELLNLTHLSDLLRMSKSLVFVPDRATARIVRKACYGIGVPQWVSGDGDSMTVFPFERNHENFATIAVLPALVTGWRSLAEQIIWIGFAPEGIECDAVYKQACGRAPFAVVHHMSNWGTP
jgi:hypothetical protein